MSEDNRKAVAKLRAALDATTADLLTYSETIEGWLCLAAEFLRTDSLASIKHNGQWITRESLIKSIKGFRVDNRWPRGCPKTGSCSRHRACMYGCFLHRDRPADDLRAEIDGALAAMAERTSP